jgi:membrane-bound lytic murein transglycosylase D
VRSFVKLIMHLVPRAISQRDASSKTMISCRRAAILFFLLFCLLLLGSCHSEKSAQQTLPAPQATAPALEAAAPAPPPAAETKEIPPPPQAAAAASAAASPSSSPDPVELWVSRAEAEFARGQANYKAGHLDAAKDDFDAAFNLLLRAPVRLQSDDRLQAEFDRIVDATNDLEMQALKVGDGFTEQQAEPAPIDEANSITFPADPSIKAKAQAELARTHSDLPLMLTDPVVSYINYFSSRGHGTLEKALIRSGRYKDMIERIFREEKVPLDLMYLAQAESGFQPLALSHMGARGMWQFMPYAGKQAGLERNWWVDERQDPEKATRAAAGMLKELYNQFGDWYLAMAAYNSGAGTVQRAVQRTGYADFWELYKRNVLPQETRNYVPIILAMTIMAKNPSQYGLDQLTLDPPLKTDTVRLHYPIDLRLVAECVDSSTEELEKLNPSLLRMTTPKNSDFDLHLPAGTTAKFQQAVAAIPEDMRVSWRYHRVENGETLSAIARRYRTTVGAIREVNNLNGDELAENAKLIIPISRSSSRRGSREGSLRYSRHATHYRIRRGDTILSVADRFGVPAEKVRQWNRLKGNSLYAGRYLTIFRPTRIAEDDPPSRSVRHRRSHSSASRHSRHRTKHSHSSRPSRRRRKR